MRLERIGLLGLIALIIAVTAVSKFLAATVAARHPDNPLSQAVVHYF